MNTKKKIDERVVKLVLMLGTATIPRRELIPMLGLRLDGRRNFRVNYLNPARERGLVEMEYPEVPSLPIQAYRLTAKGLEYLAELSKKDPEHSPD